MTPELHESGPDMLALLTATMGWHTPTSDAGLGRRREREPASPLEPGAVVNGRYSIRGVIGRGGMGWVYDALDGLNPTRAVALKLVRGLGQNAERASLFEAEFRTMAKLDHPNIARAYDFEQIRGSDDCLITMERIDGAPVDKILDGRQDWPAVVEYVVQVCRALSYVHSRHIVHCDLKPDNILVNNHGVAKVVDFGIAREAAPVDAEVMGTLLYMAPEVLVGASPDLRADLYSLGISLYQLLVGDVPCPRTSPSEIVAWVVGGTVHFAASSTVPDWLQRIVQKLCAKDLSQRYRSANAVIQAINAGGGLAHELETSATRQSYVLTPRFAGRQRESDLVMAFLAGRLSDAHGEPALLVSGLSGIGKSRLMKEVRQKAQLQRMIFLESNCYEGSPAEYGPVADLLYQLVPLIESLGGGEFAAAALPELVRIAPRLARGRQFVASPPGATAEDERVRMLEATSEFFVRCARLVPCAIYVNDLQWAGRGPAQAFAHLAERVRDDESLGRPTRLALLASYRSDETEDRPLSETLKRLRAGHTALELELSPLGEADVREVIQSMLGVDAVPHEFLERVTVETAGNPFFIQELMRVLFEDGTVYLDAGEWTTHGSIGDLHIPPSIADVFRRRFPLLGPELQDALRILSVHARPVRLEQLGQLLGNLGSAMNAARALAERGFVTRAEGKRIAYAIAHDRMRETIYSDLSEERRRHWHKRIAESLEETAPSIVEDDTHLDQLAHHYWQAGIRDKALKYAIPAGTRAMQQFSNQAATEHFAHALSLLDPDDARRDEIFEFHADMLVRLSRFDEALAGYHELLRTFTGRSLAEARVNGKLADIHVQRSELDVAAEHGWKALEVYGEKCPRSSFAWFAALGMAFLGFVLTQLGVRGSARPVPNVSARILAHDRLVFAYFFSNQIRALYCALRGWRLATRCDDPAMKACGYRNLGVLIGVAGMRRWGYQLLDQAMREAAATGSRRWPGKVEFMRAVVVRMDGHWELEPLERAVDDLRNAGDMFDLGAATYHAADVSYFRGNITQVFQRVRAYNAAALRVSQGTPPSVRGTLYIEASCRAMRGEPDAERRFQRLLELEVSSGNWVASTTILHRWGETMTMNGRVHEGLAKLEQSHAQWTEKRLLDSYSSEVLFKLPRAYLKLDTLDRERTRRLRRVHGEAMRKTRKRHANWRPPTLVNQALLLERSGKPAKADACFADALALARRQEAGFFVSDALYEWGLVALKRGETTAADVRLNEARQIAEAGGNVWLAERCWEARAQLHGAT